MKVSYNWLKQYINFNESPEEIAEILTNTGLEVEGLEKYSSVEGDLDGLIVGFVKEKTKHPNADKLALAKVDIGAAELLDIVCGASNLEAGQKVVVATVGTTIYPTSGEPFTIKKAKIRGEASIGMICAEDEIGLGYSHDGIIVLDEDTKIGTPASDIYEVEKDYVFEIGLTPNRTDAMSHIGVARDIAAALNAANNTDVKINFPEVKYSENSNTSKVKITIEDKEACPRYSGAVIENLSIAPSPTWLQNKLNAIGIRPINNVVDITNYILKEYGQALHAFDLKEVAGNHVIIKTLKEGAKFTTLDKVERNLSNEDLMICNEKEAMCIAGVFGGVKSGVKDTTTSIFLESAYFSSTSIRKTSTRHGLRTDAAQRYEKGADPEITIIALKRAIQLMEKLAGGQLTSPIYDVYPTKIEPTKIVLRHKKLKQISGIKFDNEVVEKILLDLDFEIIDNNENELTLKAPLYRADVLREADVIEEVMRIYGFNNIETPSGVKSTLSFRDGIDTHALKEKTAFILNGLGFYEIMTNSISQSNFYDEDTSLVRLQNSMTAELDSMRASLVPGALQVLQHNINRKSVNLKMYEFGNIYNADYTQNEKLALYYTGQVLESNWLSKKQTSTIFHLKGVVQAVLEQLGLKDFNLSIINDNEIFLDKDNLEIVKIWEINNSELNKFEIEQNVYCAMFNWENLIKMLNKYEVRFKEITKFPEVSRDLAVILEENINFDAIFQKVMQNTGDILKKIDLFDVFKDDKKIGVNKKSYALNFKLQNNKKTLTDKEIDKTMKRIIQIIEQNFDATIRK